MLGQKPTGHARLNNPHRAQAATAERKYAGKAGLVSRKVFSGWRRGKKKGLGVEAFSLQDASAIPEVLRQSAQRLSAFRERVEEPFGSKFADRLAGGNSELQLLMKKHRPAFDGFLATLHRLNVGEPFEFDVEVRAAIAEFEFFTARIPAQASG